jgi:hypothetical protein
MSASICGCVGACVQCVMQYGFNVKRHERRSEQTCHITSSCCCRLNIKPIHVLMPISVIPRRHAESCRARSPAPAPSVLGERFSKLLSSSVLASSNLSNGVFTMLPQPHVQKKCTFFLPAVRLFPRSLSAAVTNCKNGACATESCFNAASSYDKHVHAAVSRKVASLSANDWEAD